MKCNAPINSGTRLQLEGDELIKALCNPASERCGEPLELDDQFCPYCGAKVSVFGVANDEHPKPGFFSFKGRASKKEYFLTWLAFLVVGILLAFVAYNLGAEDVWEIIGIASVPQFFVIPVFVRRVHDSNLSGYWVLGYYVFCGLLCFLPDDMLRYNTIGIINQAAWLSLVGRKSTVGWNKYGPCPLKNK